jgi:hypothetical protein
MPLAATSADAHSSADRASTDGAAAWVRFFTDLLRVLE